MIIAAPRLFTGTGFMGAGFTGPGPGAVVVENGRITAVLDHSPANPDITLPHGFLSPGLIDLHNNGAFGIDCATATPQDWTIYIDGLARHGVLSVLPTIITAPIAGLQQAAAGVLAAMASHPAILGLHLEGPFLSPEKPGAHRPAWLQDPSAAAIAHLLSNPALAACLKLITLAPERPGALEAIRRLTAAGYTVSLGHTNASAAQMTAAADAGATMVTHVFTTQSPLHHRAPGAPGIALTDPRLHPCIIADGQHIDPVILQLAFAACPRLIAVTDSILLAGLPPGSTAAFGGAAVRLDPAGLARRQDGTIAGAAITLDAAIRRLIAAGIAPETALTAATARPADALRLTDRGRLTQGARADLVWWDDGFNVQQSWAAGSPIEPPPPAQRGTEFAQPQLHDLDTWPTTSIVAAFLAQEATAQRALTTCTAALAKLADDVAARMEAGGRLFYLGAGTSGRLALLDAVECGPTFGIPAGVIIPLLAGGDTAYLQAAEGAEDDGTAAIAALTRHHLCAADTVIGIAASGTTPYTLAGITHARQLGTLTAALINNPNTPLANAAAYAITIDSGPEIIAGSTRLSAATTQKIALNTLTSTVMIRLGKTHGPHMVDLRATNEKLRRRAIRTTALLADTSEDAARAALTACNYHVKTAIVMLTQNLPADLAAEALTASSGSLRRALLS